MRKLPPYATILSVMRMKYNNIVEGIFLARPNRFIAHVEIDGAVEVCHVKNTGRCAELLIRGVRVFLQRSDNPARKTKYDLIAVYKGEVLINMDSQAPNKAAAEFIPQLFEGVTLVKPEAKHGDSRYDFYVEAGERKIYMEVKGVTLEENGVAMFPDAPTERGVKHLNGLVNCIEEGFEAAVLFVIQMQGVHEFRANVRTHPEFGEALRRAAEAGVRIYAMDCRVTPDEMTIDAPVAVVL